MHEADDAAWMELAIAQARAAAAMNEVPVGCVIVKDGAVIASGHNLRESERDPTAHAEMIAIRAAARAIGDHRLGGATAYVTLEPCAMCAGALVHARVDRVVYGCTDPKAGAVHTLFAIGRDSRLNHVFEVEGGVRAEECASLLRAFFESLRAQGKK
jgi:tRNA(adenine34) deaminase